MDQGQTKMLDVIRVEPHVIRHKVVADILQGKPPTVLEFAEWKGTFEEFGMLLDKVRTWFVAIRAPFLVAGVPPVVLGSLIALKAIGSFDPYLFLLTLAGVLLAHISVNLMNDYFDHKLETDVINREFVRPFSGGSRVLQLGLLSPLGVLSGALLCLVGAVAVAVYLAMVSTPLVLVLALLGALSIFAYNVPPIRLSGLGLGELLVGLNFGLLITLGSFTVQTRALGLEPVLSSVPLAVFIALILLVNEFPDYGADRSTGRRTLVVLLGRRKARWVYVASAGFAYTYIVVAVSLGILPPYAALSLLAVPITVYASKYLFRNYDSPFDMIPSYVATILSYLSVGFLIVAAYLMMTVKSHLLMAVAVAAIVAYVLYEYYQIRRDLKAFLIVKDLTRTV